MYRAKRRVNERTVMAVKKKKLKAKRNPIFRMTNIVRKRKERNKNGN